MARTSTPCEAVRNSATHPHAQLELPEQPSAVDELYEACAEAVRHWTLKEAAYALGTDAGTLANALARRDRHYLRVEWLPLIAAHAPDARIARLLAGLQGHDLTEARPLSAEDRLALLEANLSPLLVRQIYAGARR